MGVDYSRRRESDEASNLMAIEKLHIRAARTTGLERRTIARVIDEPLSDVNKRSDAFLMVTAEGNCFDSADMQGYAALLVEKGAEGKIPNDIETPLVTGYNDLRHFLPGCILAIESSNGSTRVLYRPQSENNALFATPRCNSNCLMCSQPPTLQDDGGIVDEHLRVISLIENPPATLGITGGEPTLLGDGLVSIIAALKERFPDTFVPMLTNGRLYAYDDLPARIGQVAHPGLLSAIPLYADIAPTHDYIVQTKGAFDQTLQGLYNMAKHGLRAEIRVVLHRQTIPRLLPLMEFIYRNLPFVDHVALMGLENMGYVKKNWGLLWIDPVDYTDTLMEAVRHLFYRGMSVSVYNLPLCVLPHTLWPFARKSISDFKNIYLPECDSCAIKPRCAGLFASSESRHSRSINPITMDEHKATTILDHLCTV